MSRAALLLVLPVVIGCSKKDEPAADTTAAMAPAATETPAAAAMNVAGKWSVRVMPDGKDTTLLTYMLEATNDKAGWTMTLPNRQPMEIRVLSMDADSIVTENGPYASALQKGVMVTTHGNLHLEGDKLVGTTVAHYDSKGPDSVKHLRMEGMRSQ